MSALGFSGHCFSNPRRYSYDVFLSFRGEDTRYTFIGHLRHALRQNGVDVFVDDDSLRKGGEISPALERGIEESRVSIVVLSENYAGSAWCLNELVKIIECSSRDEEQVIVPVFYGVDPSDVRIQKGAIGAAFEKHERRFGENVELVMKWREAMKSIANLSGWTLKKNECESTLIKSIVKDVLGKLHRKSLHVADFPVGLERHVNLVLSMLKWNSVVGLFGIGGVGKTTVAKAVYNFIAYQFEGSCFLANVRANSKLGGLTRLQEALLDIACFLRGESKDHIMEILDACGFKSLIGIEILGERSLVSIEHGVIQMHDLLQLMGWEIVRQESVREPGKRSRLWSKDDVLYVLSNSLGTNAVEGIVIDLTEPEEVHLGHNAFANMTTLRLLVMRDAHFSGAPLCLPSSVRWIELPGCSFPSLDFNFGLKKLKEVNLSGLNFKRLGAGFQNFKHMTSINFADCGQLVEIPDFSTVENLETLILRCCDALIKVHESVGFLPKLVTLDLHSCYNLSSFPSIIKLKSLQTFVLSGCTKLRKFPHVGEYMTCLDHLFLENSGIEDLPSSIERLVNLQFICLDGCKNLTCLPPSIYKLHYLRLLYLSNCSKLGKFPELIEDVDSICLPCCCSSSRSANFTELVLRNCNLRDVDNLLAPQSFTTLRGFDLSENPSVSLPASIGRLLHLDWLCLEHCEQLQEISQLPPNITHLYVSGCKSLRKFLGLSRVSVSDMKRLPFLELVDFSNCHSMTWFADGPSAEVLRTTSVDIYFPGSEIPKWFSHRSSEGTILFQVPWDRFWNCKSFVLGVLFGLEESLTQERGTTDGTIEYNYSITVNGLCIKDGRCEMQCVDSDHLWLFYGSQELLWSHRVVEYQLHGSVCLMFSVVVNRAPSNVILKSCGVHLT